MVTALDQASDKVRGLEAGADDFLTKPVDDIALMTRVKNLARLKALSDEMMLRMATSADFKQLQSGEIAGLAEKVAGRILLVEDQARVASRILSWLEARNSIDIETDLLAAMLRLAEQPYDLLIVSLSLGNADGLRLCGQVRSLERTRHLPIIVLVEPSEQARLLRALDMGVNDYLTRPIDKSETCGARAHANQTQTPWRLPARPARGKRRARRHRRPHRPQQSQVHGSAPQGPRRRGAERGSALIGVAGRRRQLQVD